MNNKHKIKRIKILKRKKYDKYKSINELVTFLKKNFIYKKRKFCCYFILIIIIISIIIFITYIFKNQMEFQNVFKIFSKKEQSALEYNLESHLYSRRKTLDRGLPFIKNCREGKLLINPDKFKYTSNPKITAVIPVYNCEKTLKAAIRSIQNQDMLDIEIILVNDNSNKKTIELIEELKKEDPRIKVINNEKRKGQFYSRNIGALESKGKYILNLDSDDMYIDTDVFNTLYYSIKEGDFDVVAHKMFEAYSFHERHKIREHMFNGRKHNLTIYQPRLGCYAISTNGHRALNDLNIWGKLYKTSVYQKAVNALGKERYSYYVVFIEDYLMLHLIYNMASSFKFSRKYGLFHKVSAGSNSRKINRIEKFFGDLFFTEVIFDFRKPECKLVSVKRLGESSGRYSRTNEENKNYLIKIYKKIMAANDIEEDYKKKIRNNYRKYSPFNTSEFQKY